MGKSALARLTPSHAAALKERSFFPPISKTIPTFILQRPSLATMSRVHEDERRAIATTARASNRRRIFILTYLDRSPDETGCIGLFRGYCICVLENLANPVRLRSCAGNNHA